MDKFERYLEEYKICNEKVYRMEKLIWGNTKVTGIGTMSGILVPIIISGKVPIVPIVLLGAFVSAYTWMWWGMACRWWDVQRAVLDRMVEIEKVFLLI